MPSFLLPLTILLELGGGLAVLFGLLTRTVALFTAGFTLLTALIFHSNFAEGMNQLMFMKNLKSLHKSMNAQTNAHGDAIELQRFRLVH